MHPDDPPWSIFGLPRIITNGAALRRMRSLVDHPANCLTFCMGSTGESAENDVPTLVPEFAAMQPVHFTHCRNVQRTGPRSFREVSHPPAFVDVELHAVLTALHDHDST